MAFIKTTSSLFQALLFCFPCVPTTSATRPPSSGFQQMKTRCTPSQEYITQYRSPGQGQFLSHWSVVEATPYWIQFLSRGLPILSRHHTASYPFFPQKVSAKICTPYLDQKCLARLSIECRIK